MKENNLIQQKPFAFSPLVPREIHLSQSYRHRAELNQAFSLKKQPTMIIYSKQSQGLKTRLNPAQP